MSEQQAKPSMIQEFVSSIKERLKELYYARREIESLKLQREVLTNEIVKLTEENDELLTMLEQAEHEAHQHNHE